jgi:hypothetical protein
VSSFQRGLPSTTDSPIVRSMNTKGKAWRFLVLVSMLLGLPLLGVWISGRSLSPYFEFPPRTMRVIHAPVSWWAFAGYTFFIGAFITPFLVQMAKPGKPIHVHYQHRPFPWWGWFGVVLGSAAWILSWTRFVWFRPFQAHTFTPLWFAYILTVNALTLRRTGRCLLLDRSIRFLLLFPLSAVFWWFFEYLNRFVQNWQYVGGEFGPGEYVLYATLSFSTVLPAVMSTRNLILSFPFIHSKYGSFLPLRLSHPRRWGTFAFCAAAAGLGGLAIWPDHLYALLWISPLLILVSLQAIMEEPTIFSPLARGDWTGVLSCALAGLICGFFWEMWNYYSLAKWTYHVPFVQRFKVFEMPILGYAGYLPFGLECAVISEMVLREMKSASAGTK